MLTSFSEFKFFQSFRIPVEDVDGIRFLVERQNDEGKWEYVDDALLMDVSVGGLGLSTIEKISVGKRLRFSIQFKKIILDLTGKVVRAFTNSLKDDNIIYGVELDEDDDIKRFVEQLITGFSPDRSKDCLLQLSLKEPYANAHEGFEMFSLILSLFKDMSNFGERQDFLENMLEEVTRVLNAQRATIFLINPDSNELEAVVALGTDKKMLRFDYRHGIAGSVFTTGVSLNIDTINDSSRFSDTFDKRTGFKTKSILCNPVYNREDKIIGVIEVLNKRNEDRFTAEDEKTMKVIALVFSSVFHNYNPISEKSTIRRFSTPFDREFAMIGNTPSIKDLRDTVLKLKDLDCPVLIYGEPGTGKTLYSKILHHEGNRGLRPYVYFHSGGKTEQKIDEELFGTEGAKNKLEECAGGVFFFHEIWQLPLDSQQKLFNVLTNQNLNGSKLTLDIRVIASSTKDLDKLVGEGKFNKDLFSYISKSYVRVDPLRKRRDDIEMLISYCLKCECKKQGLLLKSFSPAVMEELLQYDWPGNIQELMTCVQRAVLYNPKSHIITNISKITTPLFNKSREMLVDFENIPYATNSEIPLKDRVSIIERHLILSEIKRNNDNKSKAAKKMGISREALRKKLLQSDQIMTGLEGEGSAPAAKQANQMKDVA